MLELDTKGYILDASLFMGETQGKVLKQFAEFIQENKNLSVTCSTPLYEALTKPKSKSRAALFEVVAAWVGPAVVDKLHTAEWLNSSTFESIRKSIKGIVTNPREFDTEEGFDQSKQVSDISLRNHFGILASGAALGRNLRKRGVNCMLKIEGG